MDFGETSALAKRLGLHFDPARHYSLADDYSFLPFLAHGQNRYVFNVLSGRYQESEVMAFDFHYETDEKAENNDLTNSHHYLTTAMLLMPAYFPKLRIVPESWGSKIEESLAGGDVQFESAEFNRAFRVCSSDKRLAYDICNPQVIDYLLENRDLNLQVQNCTLATASDTQWSVQQVEANLKRLSEIRARLPEYLFQRS